ncbi:MAG TPA: gamma carbonic anhydrase family protein [Stellaceae bacterium]|nr:gamma carbonic anhydrase family protein [Stellaceae bacterium]
MTGPLILPHRNIRPRIHPTAWIAPGASIVGDVEIGAHANIWFNVVIRGDDAPIRIGAGANIQDGTIIHVTYEGFAGGDRVPTIVGENAVVAHMVLLHGCTIEPDGFVGMKACVMDRAVVEGGAMVAAGALVTPRKRVKAGELWSGAPARLQRPLKPDEIDYMRWVPGHYRSLAAEYREQSAAASG